MKGHSHVWARHLLPPSTSPSPHTLEKNVLTLAPLVLQNSFAHLLDKFPTHKFSTDFFVDARHTADNSAVSRGNLCEGIRFQLEGSKKWRESEAPRDALPQVGLLTTEMRVARLPTALPTAEPARKKIMASTMETVLVKPLWITRL